MTLTTFTTPTAITNLLDNLPVRRNEELQSFIIDDVYPRLMGCLVNLAVYDDFMPYGADTSSQTTTRGRMFLMQ